MKTKTLEIKTADAGYNPYLAARVEWDERYGSHMKQAAAWKRMAFFGVLLALAGWLTNCALLYRQQHVAPFVAVVDGSTGRLIASGAEANPTRDEQLLKNSLRSFVEDWRLVTPDVELQRRAAIRALEMLGKNTKAHDAVIAWWKADPPTSRAEHSSVYAEIDGNPLKVGSATYQVNWTETERMQGGDPIVTKWKAAITIAVKAPASEEEARANTLGIHITDINWEKQDR